RRSWVRSQHGALLDLGGAGPPQTFSAQVGYLLGLSVWSFHVLPVFTRGFLHKNPNSTLSYQSLTKMDGSLHLVPGRLKAALGSWRKDNPGWGNAEVKFTAIV